MKKFSTGLIDGYAFCGKYPGKTLLITTGVHGGEYVGIEAVKRLIKELDLQNIHGNIIICPLLNTDGFYYGLKQVSPIDSRNLNREFPGDCEGSKTQRIAADVEKYLYPQADFIIDLHGGDINEGMTPLIFFPCGVGDEMADYVRNIVKRMDVGFRVRSYTNNGLYSFAATKGISGMLYERGGMGLWSEEDILLQKKDLYKLMEILEIRRSGIDIDINNSQIEIDEVDYVESMDAGFWYPRFKNGDRIKGGVLLGELKDIEDRVVQSITAKFDGIVLYYTLSLGVKKGDILMAVGR